MLVKTDENVSKNNHTKKSVTKPTEPDKISVCDVMKSKTSSVIRKMESQIPSYMQEYSDLYTEYLQD